MVLLDRLHALAARIGVKPAVLDPIVFGVLAIAAHAILTGEWNVTELRYLGVLALYAVVAAGAPPSLGVTQSDVETEADRIATGEAAELRRTVAGR